MFGLEVLNGEMIYGRTFDEVKDKLYAWQSENSIGASQWCWGELRLISGDTCTKVGWVSYNGRLWAEKQ